MPGKEELVGRAEERGPPVVAEMESSVVDASNPSWFTPLRLLVIFCVINMINYVDRGAMASNGVNGHQTTCTTDGTCTSGSGIQGQFNLNNFEDGVLSSAFMVGLLLACPIFASLAKRVNPFRLIGVGLSVWTLAVVGCGLSFNFWSIAVCRMVVGVGEASFISLAAPFIDDNAPADKKTSWLGVFYMCIPTGYAIGYLYGGSVGQHLGWRYAFWGEAILMVPFVVLGFVLKPLQLKGFAPREIINAPIPVDTAASSVKDDVKTKDGVSPQDIQEERAGSSSNSVLKEVLRFLKDMKALLVDKVFVVNVLGYVAYNFVIGAYSYWGPKAGYSIYQMKSADIIFGGITVVSGIVGTLAGGYILDRMNNTISNAFKLLSMTTFIGAAFCFGAFCFKSLYGFVVLFAIGELLVFAIQGPVNFICLHCVKPSLRPLSMAISTVSIHIFGDVPSAPLVGVLQDHLNNWRKTALILTAVFFPAAIIWFIGIFLHSVDRFNDDNEKQVTTNRSNEEPSLKLEKVQQTNNEQVTTNRLSAESSLEPEKVQQTTNRSSAESSPEPEKVQQTTNRSSAESSLEPEKVQQTTNRSSAESSLEPEKVQQTTNRSSAESSLEPEKVQQTTNRSSAESSLEPEKVQQRNETDTKT
ncbi:probable sphingolipid transporter spinster homolog 2 isoform X2 [Cucurbita pepo subsp. pepo]|uniref:probable sphingolipid transporter spinster homolog 2 isoform X2 n=1 Tax=Cucurbita pepo subsp. pepo TaxID=3664 RepID=UPI000C9D7AA6|nr:probable sphingolipid transporter spinster homolog 2 isoform X2 [Cucurbita pepo subsp. pepo]